jgi:hypothetical protein
MRRLAAGVLLLALVAGCAAPGIPPAPVPAAAPDLSLQQLEAPFRASRFPVLRLRQTARFTFRGRTVPMVGMMELARERVRLVAVNEMGIKLFDLEVGRDGVREHFVLPQLARFPRFGEAVAASLRRLFLAPGPEGSDLLAYGNGHYTLTGNRPEGPVRFLFGGRPARLAETEMSGEKEKWRAVYRDYRTTETGIVYPREILLQDFRAGYLLALRIDEVKPSHEPTE